MATSIETARRSGRRCTVCAHADRAKIETALSSGEFSIRGIARQWGLAPENMRRHVRGHLAPDLREQMESVQGLSALSIADRLLNIADAARDIRLQADDAGDDRLALAAGRAEEATLTTIAERLGVTTADAMGDLRDAHDLLSAFRFLSREQPAVAHQVADALEQRGRAVWATSIRDGAQKIHNQHSRKAVAS
jgi:hypothetical protein